jgi:dephospho-CoA kinase
MLKVALTGSIASGKSLVLKELSKHFKVINADKIAHSLYNKKSIKEKLLDFFGTYNRKKLSLIVFKDKKKLKKLEKIFWPLVLKEINKKIRALKKKKIKVIVIEVPLLFEARLEKKFDFIILVYCQRKKQIQRLLKKGFSFNEAIQRIKSQMPLNKKIKKADFIINNSFSFNKTRKQIAKLLFLLKKLSLN